jgi:hypothetical protein
MVVLSVKTLLGTPSRDLVETRSRLAAIVARFFSRSHDAVIRAYDESDNMV